jgi:hypothetical protein
VTREKDAKAEQLTAALPTDKTIFEPGGLIPRSKPMEWARETKAN